MKLYQINTTYGSGSTGRIACQIGDVIINNGGKCRIAYGRGYAKNNFKSEDYKVGNRLGIYAHVILSRIFDRQGEYSSYATKKLVQDIKSYNPDLIQLHNIHGYYLNHKILFKFLKEYNKPIVWTFHDCWPITGHCAYFDFNNCSKCITSEKCSKCLHRKSYPKSIIFSNSRKNFLLKEKLFTSIPLDNIRIVTPSLWLGEIISKSFLHKVTTSVINNGVDTSIFTNLGDGYHNFKNITKPIVLGCASIWEKRKGLDDIIEISRILGNKVQIVIVGVNSKQIKELPDSIIGIERTENINDLASIYRSASIYINPTYEDNFPTTNIESLACGTPLVTYKTGGSPESINEFCGLVVDKGDVIGMANSILRIIEDNNFAINAIKRGKVFNQVDSYNKYSDLYDNILK